jgi:hypothetical protein
MYMYNTSIHAHEDRWACMPLSLRYMRACACLQNTYKEKTYTYLFACILSSYILIQVRMHTRTCVCVLCSCTTCSPCSLSVRALAKHWNARSLKLNLNFICRASMCVFKAAIRRSTYAASSCSRRAFCSCR